MTKRFSAVAIGGPADGKIVDADEFFVTVPIADGASFEYALRSICGSYYWASQLEDTGELCNRILDRYSKFRDFASGTTMEVINRCADRVQELETANAGHVAREQNLREEIEANELLHQDFVRDVFEATGVKITKKITHRAEDEALAYVKSTREIAKSGSETINEIRRLCEMSGFGDRSTTAEGLVVQLTAAFERTRATLEDVKKRHNETIDEIRSFCAAAGFEDRGDIADGLVKKVLHALAHLRQTHIGVVDEVRAVLKSTGHKNEGATLDHLVDIAIDRERDRHGQSLLMIGEAVGISFAIGANYEQRVEVIINSLKRRFQKVAMAADVGASGMQMGERSAGPELTIAQRLIRLERKVGLL